MYARSLQNVLQFETVGEHQSLKLYDLLANNLVHARIIFETLSSRQRHKMFRFGLDAPAPFLHLEIEQEEDEMTAEAHYYKQARAHQRKCQTEGLGSLTVYASGRTERAYGSAPYGEHALSAYSQARLSAYQAEQRRAR